MKKILKWDLLLAAALLLAGAYFYFCVVGYRFSAFACCLGAGVLLVRRVLTLFRRKWITWAYDVAVTAVLLVCFVTLGLIVRTAHYVPAEPCDYVIVLGAGVHGTVASRSLSDRIQGAYAYLTANPQTVCVVSGGKGDGESISEADCMYRDLTAMGIDGSRILKEDKATNTLENITYSMAIIEQRGGGTVGILSGEYHLYRAGLVAKRLGISAVTVPARTSIFTLRLNYYMREVAATWYCILFGGYGFET